MSNDQLLSAMRAFLACEKPSDLTPLDLLQTLALLLEGADEQDPYKGQETRALELASSPDSIAR